jgi:hypothetical protein
MVIFIPVTFFLLSMLIIRLGIIKKQHEEIQQQLRDLKKNQILIDKHEKAHQQQRDKLAIPSTVADELYEYRLNQQIKRWRKG